MQYQETKQTRMLWWEWLLLALLLMLFGWQVTSASLQKSASFDEQYHLAAGASYLFTGDFRMATTHPPLAGFVAATGLLGREDVVVSVDHPSWQESNQFGFADEFLWRANDNAQQLLIAARGPILLFGILLLVGIWGWARQAWGRWAGWLAFLLAVFDPNLLANSRLVTSDLALTCFFFLAIWRFWHWLKRPLRQAQGKPLRQAQGKPLRQAQGKPLRQAQCRPLMEKILCVWKLFRWSSEVVFSTQRREEWKVQRGWFFFAIFVPLRLCV